VGVCFAHLFQPLKSDLVITSNPLLRPCLSHTPVTASVAAGNQVSHTAGLKERVVAHSGGDELRMGQTMYRSEQR